MAKCPTCTAEMDAPGDAFWLRHCPRCGTFHAYGDGVAVGDYLFVPAWAKSHAAIREALVDLLRMVTSEPYGAMSGMADQVKRVAWYELLHPVREKARAALILDAKETP